MIRPLTLPDLNPMKGQEANTLVTSIAATSSKNAIFAGTGEYGRPGGVRCYNHPINAEFDEYSNSNSQIVRMRLTPDENFLVVADDLGCIAIYELRSRQDRMQRALLASEIDRELITLDSWSDEILVPRNELDERNNAAMELKAKVEELKLHNDYQLKLKDMIFSDKMKETNEKLVQELEQRRTAYDLLKEEKTELESEYQEKIKQAEEEHQYKVQEIESTYQAQIMELVDNYQQLVRERDAQTTRLQEQRNHLIYSHERYVNDLLRDYERKVEEEQQVRIQLSDQRTDTQQEIQEIENQFDDDIDTEIENLRSAYDEKLTFTRETTLKLKGENGIMKKKRIVYQREIETQRDEIKALLDKDKEYHVQIGILEKEIKSHKKEIKSRDLNIAEKEKKIYDLKKKNQELDKFKFVLDYKIRELKQQIEPRQVEIVKMKEKINEMDLELEKYHKSNAELDDFIGTLRSRIETMQGEIKSKRQIAIQCENFFSHFRNDLQNAMKLIQIPNQLKSAAEALVAKHGSHSGVMKPRLEPEIEEEYHRHRDFLEKSIEQLKSEMDTSLNTRVEANSQLRNENLELIEIINRQRDENRETRNKLQADIGRYRRLAQQYADRAGSRSYSRDSKMESADMMITDSMTESSIAIRTAPREEEVDPMDILTSNQRRIQALESIIESLGQRKDAIASSTIEFQPQASPKKGEYFVMPFVTAKTFDADETAVEEISLPAIPSASH
jgi:cilia- and flagella-associated protein 57